jgi:hypothetical protein
LTVLIESFEQDCSMGMERNTSVQKLNSLTVVGIAVVQKDSNVNKIIF